jgi:hypothetical protein
MEGKAKKIRQDVAQTDVIVENIKDKLKARMKSK